MTTKAQRKEAYLTECEINARHDAMLAERAAHLIERSAWYAVCEDANPETAAAWYESAKVEEVAAAHSENLQPLPSDPWSLTVRNVKRGR